MIDRRIMPEEERKVLVQMLDEIDPGARYSVARAKGGGYRRLRHQKRLKPFSDKEYAKRLENEVLGLKEFFKIRKI